MQRVRVRSPCPVINTLTEKTKSKFQGLDRNPYLTSTLTLSRQGRGSIIRE